MKSNATSICLLVVGLTCLLVASPAIASGNFFSKLDASCSGTAVKISGDWTIVNASCTGSCGSDSCTAQWTSTYRWCGCNGLQPACCFVRIKLNPSGNTVEAAGDCPSCPTTGACTLYETEQSGKVVKKVKCE